MPKRPKPLAPAAAAEIDLGVMCDAIKRDASQFFHMGRVRARKKLANGAVATFTLVMPAEQPPVKR
jgi:hypothetical protein